MKISFLYSLALCCISCGTKDTFTENGTPVSGAFTLYSDETFFPLIQVLTEGYMAVYPQVVISIDTTSGSNVYPKLVNGTIRAAITSVYMSPGDSAALSQRNVFPRIFHFASDGIVLIAAATADSLPAATFTEPENKCLELSISPAAKIIITDRPGSENNFFLRPEKPDTDTCFKNWYAAGSQINILKRVSEHNGEIGIIGWSWLCENENPSVKQWRSLIDIIPYKSSSSKLIYPTQSALSTGEYPLTRKLYLVTAEPNAGPATGFAAFVASDEGQRIIRLFGLAPAKTPPREIYIP